MCFGVAGLAFAGCAASSRGDSPAAEAEATATSSSTTTSLEESTSSSSTGTPDSVWDPDREAFFFAAGSHAADAAWLSTGFVVLDRRGASLFDEDGDSAGFFGPDRPVYAGVFDGDRIVLGDTARFTVLNADLVEVGSGNLTEPCVAGVVFDDLFVCGVSRQFGQVYASYDLESGEFLAMTDDFHWPKTAMRRIPGRDEFIAFPGRLTPGKYQLFARAGESVELLGPSPHHGDFHLDAHYGFLGDPATQLVAVGGEIMRIHADGGGCEPTNSIIPGENCLVREGTLGHLPPEVGRYLDVQTGPKGTVFALYAWEEHGFADAPCRDEPCILQEIEPGTRTLLREREVTTRENRVHYMYPHPDGRGVAIVTSAEDRWRSNEQEAPSGSWEAYYVGM